MSQRAPYRFHLAASATCVLGVVALAASGVWLPPHWGLALLVLVLATLLAENMAVPLHRGLTTSLSFSMSVAANILLGPTAAGIVSLCGALNLEDIRNRVPPTVVLFNAGQVTLAQVLAGWAYLQSGGRTLLGEGLFFVPIATDEVLSLVFPIALLALVAFGVNTVMVAVGYSLKYGASIAKVWREHFAWSFSAQMSLSVVGVFVAQVMSIEILGLILFVLPLAVSRQVYSRYVRLRSGYLDTVRSLVGALEAKDLYTRGHSERVSKYAAAIAVSMGMDERQVERIKLAAQLHDLGKVGLSNALLSKPGGLTAHEYLEVRRHPRVGADLVQRVPDLADLVPIIRHHHERYDGAGYESGLSGSDIPLESRILSVADSFDAMTSERAYRSAMTPTEAVQEILSCRGSQFDPEIVDHISAVAAAYETDERT